MLKETSRFIFSTILQSYIQAVGKAHDLMLFVARHHMSSILLQKLLKCLLV